MCGTTRVSVYAFDERPTGKNPFRVAAVTAGIFFTAAMRADRAGRRVAPRRATAAQLHGFAVYVQRQNYFNYSR